MTLAGMLALDEDAVICDFAETYHVLDVWALPVPLMAALASGLREDSRIKLKMAGIEPIPAQMILAKVADEVTLFRWGFMADTDDKREPVLVSNLMSPPEPAENKVKGFDSGEEFLAVWNEIAK